MLGRGMPSKCNSPNNYLVEPIIQKAGEDKPWGNYPQSFFFFQNSYINLVKSVLFLLDTFNHISISNFSSNPCSCVCSTRVNWALIIHKYITLNHRDNNEITVIIKSKNQSKLTSFPDIPMSGGLKVGGVALSKASRAMWYISCKICTIRTSDTGISGGGLKIQSIGYYTLYLLFDADSLLSKLCKVTMAV